MKDINQKIEDLIKTLDNDMKECQKCGKKLNKQQMINIYNFKEDKNSYLCSICFKKRN